MARRDDATRAQLQAWLRETIKGLGEGETASSLARRAGLATSTLTRFLADPQAPLLTARTIAKIRAATNASGTEALPSASGQLADEGAPYVPPPEDALRHAIDALTTGRNATHPWTIATDALNLAGVLPGDIALVDLNGNPQTGEIACAQAYAWERGTAETIFRIYEPPYLVAMSTNPAHARPLLVDKSNVIIKGVVRFLLRPQPKISTTD